MDALEVKRATDSLACPVCYQVFKNAKYLPCYHFYCEHCLEKMQKQSKITCPECRKEAVVPAGGVKDLPNNFFINRLVDEFIFKRKVESEEVECDKCGEDDPVVTYCPECGLFLCHICYEAHKRDKVTRGHAIIPLAELKSKKNVVIQPKARSPMCKKHDIELLFYCETCEELICMYCAVKDHVGHRHDTVKIMAGKHREELRKISTLVDEINRAVLEAYAKTEDFQKAIKMQGDEMNKKIDQHYDKVFQKLTRQKEQVKQQLHESISQNEKAINVRLKELEGAQVEVASVKNLKAIVEESSDLESLSVKKQVVDRIQKLQDMHDKLLEVQPLKSIAMEFVSTKGHFPLFGKLYIDDVDPNACFTSDLPRRVVLNEEASFTLSTKYCDGQHCSRGGDQVTVTVESTTGEVTRARVRDNSDGSYRVSFMARHVGVLKVEVRVNGQQTKGSPYSLMVCNNYASLGKFSKILNIGGDMGRPWGIAFGRNGAWAVADSTDSCVYMFNDRNQVAGSFGSKGNSSGQFQYPSGITFDDDNCLYVADCAKHRIQKFDATGKYLLQFGSKGSGNSQLSGPVGIKAHDGEVYVADLDNHRISVFEATGQFDRLIGKGLLGTPFDVNINSSNQLLVGDSGHHCIHMFTLNGRHIGKFGTSGTGWGQLTTPCSITTDQNGFIYVADASNCHVSIFDSSGVCVHCFGSKGSGNGQFDHPRGIAVGNRGSIHVSDSWNKRIQIFNY